MLRNAQDERTQMVRKFRHLVKQNEIPTDAAEREEYSDFLEAENKTFQPILASSERTLLIFALIGVVVLLKVEASLAIALALMTGLFLYYNLVFSKNKLKRIHSLQVRIANSKDANLVKHAKPNLPAETAVSISAEILDNYWKPDYLIERLWAQDLGDGRYELLSAPFARTDLSVGDIVTLDEYSLVAKVAKEGEYVSFRVETRSAAEQEELLKLLAEQFETILHESFNSHLMVLSVKKHEAHKLSETLDDAQEQEVITEYDSDRLSTVPKPDTVDKTWPVKHRSLWSIVGLSFLTWGLYEFLWFALTKIELEQNGSPKIRSISTWFVPSLIFGSLQFPIMVYFYAHRLHGANTLIQVLGLAAIGLFIWWLFSFAKAINEVTAGKISKETILFSGGLLYLVGLQFIFILLTQRRLNAVTMPKELESRDKNDHPSSARVLWMGPALKLVCIFVPLLIAGSVWLSFSMLPDASFKGLFDVFTYHSGNPQLYEQHP